ncbi:MAG: C-terminal protein [Actinomycetota bacterium]|nr:C-terminal protein [Actinomycetota bacterium]
MKWNMTPVPTGLGNSNHENSRTAGTQAATIAFTQLGDEPAALVIVYSSARYDLEQLLSGVRSVTGPTPLIGATTHGHFFDGQFVAPDTGVVVLVISQGSYTFSFGSATGMVGDPVGTGKELARAAKSSARWAEPPPHAVLLLLSCGRTGDQQQLLNGIHRVLGAAVPVVGGASAVDRPQLPTAVFHDDRVLHDSAVGVLIGSHEPLRVVRGHGWRAHGLPQLVTDTEGNLVRSISGRPAYDVVEEALRETAAERGETPGEEGSDGVVRLGGRGRCFGIIEPDGSHLLRGGILTEDRQIQTWAPLPAYSSIQMMSCTQDSLLDVCDQIAQEATAGPDAGLLLVFGCVARCEILGSRVTEEATRLQNAAGQVRTIGFYTYGEFARTVSALGFHNATITGLAL